jgi:hypothetical protein
MTAPVPSVGRIVRYQHLPEEAAGPSVVAALITGVNGDGTLSLTAFPPGGGVHALRSVWQDEDEHEPGTWHWPPRVGP